MSNLGDNNYKNLDGLMATSLDGLAVSPGIITYANYPFISSLGGATLTRTTGKMLVHTDGTGVEDIGVGVAGFNNDGLTIDPLRTNVLTKSRKPAHADWTTNGTITADDILSPEVNEVSASAAKVESTGTSCFIQQTQSTAAGTRKLVSIIAKKGNVNHVAIQAIQNSTPANRCRFWFDLNLGIVGTTNTAGSGFTIVRNRIVDLGNDWYLCQGIFDAPSGQALRATYYVCSSDGSTTISSGNYIYMWQMDMMLADAFAAPVETDTTSVTHNADLVTIDSSAFPVNDFQFDIDWTDYGENENPMSSDIYHQQDGGNLGWRAYWSEAVGKFIMTKYTGGVVTDTALVTKVLLIDNTYHVKCTVDSATGFELDIDGDTDSSATTTDVIIPLTARVGAKDGSTVMTGAVRNLTLVSI